MSNAVISLMFAAGVGAWVYNKFMHTTGNNSKSALIATGIAAAMVFFVMFSILSLIIK